MSWSCMSVFRVLGLLLVAYLLVDPGAGGC